MLILFCDLLEGRIHLIYICSAPLPEKKNLIIIWNRIKWDKNVLQWAFSMVQHWIILFIGVLMDSNGIWTDLKGPDSQHQYIVQQADCKRNCAAYTYGLHDKTAFFKSALMYVPTCNRVIPNKESHGTFHPFKRMQLIKQWVPRKMGIFPKTFHLPGSFLVNYSTLGDLALPCRFSYNGIFKICARKKKSTHINWTWSK